MLNDSELIAKLNDLNERVDAELNKMSDYDRLNATIMLQRDLADMSQVEIVLYLQGWLGGDK